MNIPNLPSPAISPPIGQITRELENLKNKVDLSQKVPEQDRLKQLKGVTQEFEALFISYLLKVMRSTVEPADEESSSLGKDTYLEMFDNEIALSIARSRSLGIGEMMYRQLTDRTSDWRNSQAPLSSEIEVTPNGYPHIESSQGISQAENGNVNPVASPNLNDQTEAEPEEPVITLAQPIQGIVSSSFGLRKDPLTQALRFHHGIDLAAPAGTPIRAAHSGTVIYSGFLDGYGNTIILEHDSGYQTLYAHAARNWVGLGDSVKAQQILGIVGSTGRSTGTHLHFELQENGQQINPKEFLISSRYLPNH